MILLLLECIFIVIILYVLFKIYLKLTTGWCRSQVCLVGKTALVTGANTGIGYETALDFAKRGARVILACRDETKGEHARAKIIEETENENIVVRIIDMCSFASVREFATNIINTEERLDILVNNAGAIGLGDTKTVDGNDIVLQVNYFSSFLLTNLLLDLLKKSKPSRIVNVASSAANSMPKSFQIDNSINKFVSTFHNYALSKLCNILFTIELAKRIEGTGVTTYALHPGAIKTEFCRKAKGMLKLLIDILQIVCSKTAEEGAQTTIYCAVSKKIEDYNGDYFEDCQRRNMYKSAGNPDSPKNLWELSENVVNLKSKTN